MTTSFHTDTILVATYADSQGAEIDARFNVQFTRHKKLLGENREVFGSTFQTDRVSHVRKV